MKISSQIAAAILCSSIGIIPLNSALAAVTTTHHLTSTSKARTLPTLNLSSHGKAVLTLQKELQQLGYYAYPTKTGYYGAYTQGAVMTYQVLHQLAPTGIATKAIQIALAKDVAHHRRNPDGAAYHIVVKETVPERLYLYKNQRLIFTTLCNTGIAGGRTPIGSFPIYEKFVSQTMTGKNPNGTYYDDPGVPWIMYFYSGGYAVHGYVRRHYGFPESAGCVELPPYIAKQVYEKVPVGTIVTVDSGPATA